MILVKKQSFLWIREVVLLTNVLLRNIPYINKSSHTYIGQWRSIELALYGGAFYSVSMLACTLYICSQVGVCWKDSCLSVLTGFLRSDIRPVLSPEIEKLMKFPRPAYTTCANLLNWALRKKESHAIKWWILVKTDVWNPDSVHHWTARW